MNICLYNVTATIDQIGSPEVGGVEAYTFRLGHALMNRGHEVCIFGGEPKPNHSHYENHVPIHLSHYLETSKVIDLGTRFRRLMQRVHFTRSSIGEFLNRNFDSVIIFKPYDLYAAWRWRRAGFRGKIILGVHGPEFYLGDRWLARNIDRFYAVSMSTAKEVASHYKVPCKVIPNFLDLSHFPYVDRPTPPANQTILTVGRLVGWKGIATLIDAFKLIKDEFPHARLAIVGEGPELERLRSSIEAWRLQARVEFLGLKTEEEVKHLHWEAKIFAQPSIGYESFSISCLEAAASGLTLVVSNQVSIREWFPEGVLEVYPAGDIEGLAQILRRLLSEDWQQNRERGRKARAVVESYFSADAVVSEIEHLLNGV